MSEDIDRILRLPEVLRRTGLSRSTLYRKVEAGSFPRQLKIAARCAGWRESAIKGWLHNPMFYDVADFPQDPAHVLCPPAARRARSA